MSHNFVVPKPPHGSAEWLQVRWQGPDGRKRIPASSAACVHNQHEYKTSGDLAAELLSDTAPEPLAENQAMQRGNRLEPVIIQWTADLEGIELFTPDQMYAYDDGNANLIATLDGISNDGKVYEIKTISRKWTGVLPRYWYWQGVQQAICANVSEIHWRIFDHDMVIHQYTQVVSSDEKQVHIIACNHFLTYIEQGIVPPSVDHMSYDNVASIYNDPQQNAVELDDDAMEIIAQFEQAKAVRKEAEELEDKLKADLALILQNAESGTYNGDTVVTWKEQSRSTFDANAFKEKHPALYNTFKKQKTYRVMRTKKGK